jgi:hypothetical protein
MSVQVGTHVPAIAGLTHVDLRRVQHITQPAPLRHAVERYRTVQYCSARSSIPDEGAAGQTHGGEIK